MFCKFCGKEIKDGSAFCPACGKKLAVNNAEKTAETVSAATAAGTAAATSAASSQAAASGKAAGKPAKKINKKALTAIIAGAAAVVLIVLLVVILVSVLGKNKGGNYILRSGETSVMEADDEKVLIVNANGDVVKLDYSDKTILRTVKKYDINRHKAVFIISYLEGSGKNIFDADSGLTVNDLYYYDGKEAHKIVSAEKSVPYSEISADGSTALYEADGKLYSYRGGKTTRIAENVSVSAVSPDGKTVAYYKKSDDGSVKGYYNNGKEVFLVNSGYAIAIANNAKYVYLLRQAAEGDGETFFVQKKDKEDTRVKLGSANSIDYLFLNNDLSQAVISRDGNSYLSKDGGETKKIYSSPVYPLGSRDTAAYYSSYAYIVGIKDFEKAFFYATNSLRTKTNLLRFSDGELETIISGSDLEDSAALTRDEKYVIYEDEDEDAVCRVRTSEDDPEPEKLLELDEVWDWYLSQDKKVLYYCNDYFEIFAQKIGGKAVKIFDGSRESAGSMIVCNNRLYFCYEGKLYSSEGGKAKEVNTGLDSVVYTDGDEHILFIADSEGKTYISVEGRNFKKISDSDLIS